MSAEFTVALTPSVDAAPSVSPDADAAPPAAPKNDSPEVGKPQPNEGLGIISDLLIVGLFCFLGGADALAKSSAERTPKPQWEELDKDKVHELLDHCKTKGKECDLRQKDLSGVSFGYRSLKHAQLQNSKLIGADLSHCTQITPAQLGGADLSFAFLPESLEKSLIERLDYLRELNKKIGTMETILVAALIVMVLVAYATDDVGFFTNSGAVALPLINFLLPPIGFVWSAPILPLGLYLWVHFHLQQYWRTLANLPAIFPDGTPSPRKGTAWLGAGRVEEYFPVLKEKHETLQRAGAWVLVNVLYAMTPVVFTAVGWRCITLHSFPIALWYIFLVTFCVFLWNKFGRKAAECFPLSATPAAPRPKGRVYNWLFGNRFPAIFVLCPTLLFITAYGAIRSWRQWVHTPFPTENHNLQNQWRAVFQNKEVSKPKEGWLEPDTATVLPFDTAKPVKASAEYTTKCINEARAKQIPIFVQVKPAILDDADLNNLDGSGAFLAGASLKRTQLQLAGLDSANLKNAQLLNTDMWGADLSFANFQYAHLDNISLSSTNLTGAQFQCACNENLIDSDGFVA